jgi:uncharacterized protein with PIN domain
VAYSSLQVVWAGGQWQEMKREKEKKERESAELR